MRRALVVVGWVVCMSLFAKAEESPVYRDPKAPVERRVEDLLGRLTLEEKVALCHGGFVSGGVPRLGIGQIGMLDGRQGLRPVDKDQKSLRTTALPCTLSLSCTWDEDAARQFGRLLAEEMLAIHQHVLLAPMINLVRSPLGGRNFENLGEDPFQAGCMAAAYIQGVQEMGVGACACLVVANDYETRRHFTSSNMDDRTLREVHLYPSEMSVRDGKVWSMMSANSLFNGLHCAQNRRLLQEIVKNDIGFDGVMLTDWRAAYDPVPTALAGTDMTTGICQYVFGDGRLLAAVKDGQVPEPLIDEKARRVLRLYIRCGVLDADGRKKGEIDSAEHRAAARRLAAEGMVLLKNEKNLLPLDLGKLRTIMLTGPGAEMVPKGGGSGHVPSAIEVTPLDGLKAALAGKVELVHIPWDPVRAKVVEKGSIEWSPGGPQAGAKNVRKAKLIAEPEIPALCKTAKSADVVVFIAAADGASEGRDLLDMDLPARQAEAIQALAQTNPRIVVVLPTNGPVTLDPWQPSVPAIVGAWYAGQATGDALADVLTGRVNPGGKLCFTFARKLSDFPCHALGEWPPKLIMEKDPKDPGMTPKDRKAIHAFDVQYKEGVMVGYRWFDEKKIEPWFPFGHGLSYTSFAMRDLIVEEQAGAIHVACTVTNTGPRAGAEVVQVYVAPPKSSVPRPPRELKGFAKVQLQPGESRKVEITLRPSALAFFDVASGKWKVEPGQYGIEVGRSSRDLCLKAATTVAAPRLVDHL